MVFDSGVLHVSANSTPTQTTPADKIMTSGSPVTHSASAGGGGQFAIASTTASLVDDHLQISGMTWGQNAEASAIASASLTFHQSVSATLTGDFDATGDGFASALQVIGGVTVRDASNNVVMSFTSNPSGVTPPGAVTAFFPAGLYTVDWSQRIDNFSSALVSYDTVFNLTQVPEPGSLALLALPAAMLAVTRRRRGAPAHVAP
jgi:hypothetical protein